MPETTPSKKLKKLKVTFTLMAPDAEEVILMGDFNSWNEKKHPMKKNKDGLWKKDIIVPAGRYEYKFFVDGRWQIDPKNKEVQSNCFGGLNSVVVVEV